MSLYQGPLQGIMQWSDLDDLWQVLQQQSDKQWYVYHVGDDTPQSTASPEQFARFIKEMDALLHQEHEEQYCGIVYTNDPKDPALVKIYDPNNLGVVCGYSENPPLPGWVLSTVPPDNLELAFPPVQSRKRWWRKIFG